MQINAIKFLSKDSETVRQIKSFIRKSMKFNNIKNKDLAYKLNVSNTYISQLVNDKYNRFDLSMIAKIMEILEIPLVISLGDQSSNSLLENVIIIENLKSMKKETCEIKDFIINDNKRLSYTSDYSVKLTKDKNIDKF